MTKRTLPVVDPGGLRHPVKQVWAAVVEHGPDNESVGGMIFPNMGYAALFVANPNHIGVLIERAEELATASGKRVRVACFQQRIDLETFDP